MHHDRVITGVAAALAGCAVVLAVLAVAFNPAILAVAAAFGVAAYLMWFQASGRLAARVYRSVERQARRNTGGERRQRRHGSARETQGERGGFGAGPREGWTAPGGQERTRSRSADGGERQRARGTGRSGSSPTPAEAYRTLGLEPGVDEAAIRRAYREKVKEVHPDAEGGDEEAFKRVTSAYERLT